MKIKLQQFEVKGLFGNINYLINIDDNTIILVGENGSGKSTVVSMLFYFLTKQWKKLKEFDFSEMSVKINDKKLTVNKKEIIASTRPRSSGIMMFIRDKLSSMNITPEYASRNYQEVYGKLFTAGQRMSLMTFKRMLDDIIEQETQLFVDFTDNLAEIEKVLDFRILYLPTYRRIERDFKTIFPALEEDIERYNRKITKPELGKKHIELVEFGMEDVSLLINAKMNSLNNDFRSSLYSLTGGYLRVVLRKEYKNADVKVLKEIDVKTLDSILSRIDETVLSVDDRKILTQTINDLQKKKRTNDIDLISAHIISELILLHGKQYERERTVRTFANVCNKYLRNKGFYFDSNHFTLPIRPMINIGENIKLVQDGEIKLSMLSSGEKQIVSLFAHLYLSDHCDHLIIIDEPELSLSVPWQKSFLADILGTERCNGLIAVTHSPFIYENKFVDKAHSIQEFAYE